MTRLQRWERHTAPWLTALAVVSLVALVLDAAADADSRLVLLIDYLAWAAFATDYVIRVVLAEERLRFVRTRPVDLLAVLLPAVRALRLVVAVARLAALAQRTRSDRVLLTTGLLSATVVLAGAAVELEAERDAADATITTYGDALWWAVTTVTTVGYGDRYPVTAEGRLIAAVLMVVGIATMGAVTAAIAARLLKADVEEEAPLLDERIQELEAAVRRLTAVLESQRNEAAADPSSLTDPPRLPIRAYGRQPGSRSRRED